MKKLVSLLLVLMMAAALVPAFAEGTDEYPEVVEGIDFGGATLYINPYWNPPARLDEPDDQIQARYDWQDWVQETYNVKIVEEQYGEWGESQVTMIRDFITKADTNELRIFLMPPGFVGNPMAQGWFADWKNNELLDFESDIWNKGDIDFMTLKDKIYGVVLGAPEPRQCVFFNKKLLADVGISADSIYDMQKDGTWNWENFEKLVDQAKVDKDSNGVPEVYGLTGDFNDLLMASVFGNGGSFFDFDENGKLVVTAGTDNVTEAEAWAADMWNKYARAQDYDGGEPWDFFIDVFKSGKAAFLVSQTYNGYNDTSALKDMQDDFGCVAVPKGPKGDYAYLISDNIAVLPAIYDAETTRNIQYVYSLYAGPTPGEDEDAWIENKYENLRGDTRAVDETYAMLRDSAHAFADKSLYLGDNNTILGSNTYGNYMWGMRWSTPSALLEAIKPAWDGLCAVFNGDMTQDDFNKMLEEKAAAEAAAAEAAAAEAAAEETAEEAPAAE